MMLDKIDDIPAYERMHIEILKYDVDNSPYLNETQKCVIERKLQELVDVWTNKSYK